MPSIFIDDGTPEAAESTSSYVHYDEDNLDSMMAALDEIRHRGQVASGSKTAAEQFVLEGIARKLAEQTRQKDEPSRGPWLRISELFRGAAIRRTGGRLPVG